MPPWSWPSSSRRAEQAASGAGRPSRQPPRQPARYGGVCRGGRSVAAPATWRDAPRGLRVGAGTFAPMGSVQQAVGASRATGHPKAPRPSVATAPGSRQLLWQACHQQQDCVCPNRSRARPAKRPPSPGAGSTASSSSPVCLRIEASGAHSLSTGQADPAMASSPLVCGFANCCYNCLCILGVSCGCRRRCGWRRVHSSVGRRVVCRVS